MAARRNLGQVGRNVCAVCGRAFVVEILARDCESLHDTDEVAVAQ